jgi:hypothetical protein
MRFSWKKRVKQTMMNRTTYERENFVAEKIKVSLKQSKEICPPGLSHCSRLCPGGRESPLSLWRILRHPPELQHFQVSSPRKLKDPKCDVIEALNQGFG